MWQISLKLILTYLSLYLSRFDHSVSDYNTQHSVNSTKLCYSHWLWITATVNNVGNITITEKHCSNEDSNLMLITVHQQGAAHFHMCNHMQHWALEWNSLQTTQKYPIPWDSIPEILSKMGRLSEHQQGEGTLISAKRKGLPSAWKTFILTVTPFHPHASYSHSTLLKNTIHFSYPATILQVFKFSQHTGVL